MIAKLFVPHIIKDQVYHFQIGYQHIIIIENKRYINQIIVNKQIAKVFMSFSNVFFFNNFAEMEQDLEILITYTDDDYLVLTDIQGLEDFFGDMDFKVAGTHKGITAIQMDIKIHGLTRPIIEEAIAKTRKARLYIIDEVMNKAIDAPRAQVGEFAPKIVQMQIDPQKIGDVVGQRGKTINAIIEQTGVKIDITDDGAVSICGTDAKSMEEAQKLIHIIVTDFEAGQVLEGKVVSIKDFGAFLEFAPGKEGMVHISKLSKERVNRVEDVLTLGDVVKVVCLGKDKMGRISFSMKDVAE